MKNKISFVTKLIVSTDIGEVEQTKSKKRNSLVPTYVVLLDLSDDFELPLEVHTILVNVATLAVLW